MPGKKEVALMTIRLTFLCAPGGDATVDPFLGDAPLSERGLHSAGAAGAALSSHGPAVRAPSIRCAQTADALGLPAVPEPALRDLDLGAWRGRTRADVAATDPHGFSAWLTDPDAAPHGGESVRQLCRRTADWLGCARAEADHTPAVTEAAVVRAALVHALALPTRAFWHLAVPPLCAIVLTRQSDRWDVRLGYATHREPQRWFLRDQRHSTAPTVIGPRRPVGVVADDRFPPAERSSPAA
ncbi:histidine phosphatase family protein [Streptomyces sp. NPDC051452]|uniref:histidine phosphatase family protein n=1 Tax=Streptomyces sp. NPDC051452 TaxID=3365654 RepID=UPI003797D67B